MEQVIILTSKKRLVFTPLYLGWPGSKPKNHWELEMSCQDNIKDTTLRKIEKFTKDSNFTPKLVPTSQFVFADELHHFQWGNQVYFWGACSIGWLDPPCAILAVYYLYKFCTVRSSHCRGVAPLRSNVSLAAGALCQWVHAMKIYAEIYREVEPKRTEDVTDTFFRTI